MEVGQKVYLKPTERQRGNKEIQEGIILKIGRKYVEVGKEDFLRFSVKFDITDNYKQVSEYSPDWKLYFTKQEILDEQEYLNLADKIRIKLGNYGIPKDINLEQLRKIDEILEQ